MADLSDYLTRDEFAALVPAEQLAVWQAAEKGSVTWTLCSGHATAMRLYHRGQVRAVLREARAAGALAPECPRGCRNGIIYLLASGFSVPVSCDLHGHRAARASTRERLAS